MVFEHRGLNQMTALCPGLTDHRPQFDADFFFPWMLERIPEVEKVSAGAPGKEGTVII